MIPFITVLKIPFNYIKGIYCDFKFKNFRRIFKEYNCFAWSFGSLDNWFSIGNELSNNFQVHLLDLTNHGKSYHSNEHSYELMSEDLKNYINYYNLNKPSIIGHSMGGKVAMFFSFKYNYLIDNLVIVDIAPKKYKNEHAEIISALTEVSSIQLNSRKEAEQILNNFSILKTQYNFY